MVKLPVLSSAGGAGIEALRASGSSHAGIFTCSSSKLDVTGAGVLFGSACTEGINSALAGNVFGLAADGSSLARSRIFAAVSASSCFEGGATATGGFASLCCRSAKRRADNCSCKRLSSSLRPSLDGSAGVSRSALLCGRESNLISVLNSCTASARFVVTLSAAGFAIPTETGFASTFLGGIPALNGADSDFRSV